MYIHTTKPFGKPLVSANGLLIRFTMESRCIVMLSRTKCNKVINSTDMVSEVTLIPRDYLGVYFSATRRANLYIHLLPNNFVNTCKCLSPVRYYYDKGVVLQRNKENLSANFDSAGHEMTLSYFYTCSTTTGCRTDDGKDTKDRNKEEVCRILYESGIYLKIDHIYKLYNILHT